jgi:hypothetical protein
MRSNTIRSLVYGNAEIIKEVDYISAHHAGGALLGGG